MSPQHPAPYAVLRVDRRKAKAMAAIAAASAHQLRERETPNANPQGPAPVLMHLAAGRTPYQAAQHLLDGAERRNKDSVLCREVVLSASPSYFRPGREDSPGVFDVDRMRRWASAALAWAKRQWPDQLASFCLHLDEMGSPHAHLLVVPRVRVADGSWKLNSKALFDKERLREMQTSYAQALAPLGIRRGEPGSKAKHTEVAQFYGVIQAAKIALPERRRVPPAPKKPDPPAGVGGRVLTALADVTGVDTAYSRQLARYKRELAKWRVNVQAIQKENAKAWELMKATAAAAPIMRRAARAAAPPAPPSGPLPQETLRGGRRPAL
jgi:hypothetical protein